MKLYVCSTYYHILITMVKALLSKECFDLYLFNGISGYENLIDKIERTDCFDNIYIYDQLRIRDATLSKNFIEKILFNRRRLKRAVEKYSTLDFRQYSDIYIYSDHSSLGKYMVLKDIKFHLIEDALDFFKYFDRYYSVHPNDYTPGTLRYFLRKNIAYLQWGMSEAVLDIEVNDKDGIKIPTDKVIEVPRKKMFDALDKAQKLLIYNTFASEKHIDRKEQKSVLICTQPLFKDKFVLSVEEQGKVFDKAVKEFTDRGYFVVIKPHPRDEMDYMPIIKKYGCGYIDRTLPSEVLNFDPNIHYDIAASITSTSINFLDFAEEKIFLGHEFIERTLQ